MGFMMTAQIKLKILDSKQGGLGLIIAMLKGDGIKYTEIKKYMNVNTKCTYTTYQFEKTKN